MRLVFVHGMRQEGKDPTALRQHWEDALKAAWNTEGLNGRAYSLTMPFYGDVLDELTRQVRGDGSDVVTRGEGGLGTFTPMEEELIRAMARKEGVTEADARADLGQEVVARGPANWEIVQAFARVLERRVPALGVLGLRWVQQVDAYLTRPHIREAVEKIVRPHFTNEATVVVAHSLGTIVTYRILRELEGNAHVPLLVTLGSPLGIGTVKRHLKPPSLRKPAAVSKWLNGTDERDYVALYSCLDRDTFAAEIENVADIHNRREDAHAIADYLANRTVSRRIHDALT